MGRRLTVESTGAEDQHQQSCPYEAAQLGIKRRTERLAVELRMRAIGVDNVAVGISSNLTSVELHPQTGRTTAQTPLG